MTGIKDQAKIKCIKPELPGGFRDYGPADARVKQWILDTARRTFESFGFEPLETSSVQRTEVLTGGEADSDKIIYRIRPTQRGEIVGEESRDENALRFDLTVPLARFIAANPDIPRPFKRYEIGRVWRGERQQAGRWREFTQADIDIVGSSASEADAEIIALMDTTLANLGAKNFVVKINDRRLMNALPEFAGFAEDKLWDALRIIDKKDKIGEQGMAEELQEEFGKNAAEKIAGFVRGEADMRDNDDDLRALARDIEALGISPRNYRIDYSLVRGLSYYTGAVFEAVLADVPEIGSVFGGGRYDNLLMKFTGQNVPAVGASLGVDRLLAAGEKLRWFADAGVPAGVLILSIDDGLKREYADMARELRGRGIAAAVYLGDERQFQAQLAYAVKKEIPYVVIYGQNEKVKGMVAIKNMRARAQEEIPHEKMAEYLERAMKIPRLCRCG